MNYRTKSMETVCIYALFRWVCQHVIVLVAALFGEALLPGGTAKILGWNALLHIYDNEVQIYVYILNQSCIPFWKHTIFREKRVSERVTSFVMSEPSSLFELGADCDGVYALQQCLFDENLR